MANLPGYLSTGIHGYKAFHASSGFSPQEQELIFLVISSENGCDYVMLFTPGQDLLTVAMGIVLMDFPGKFSLEKRVAQNRPVMRSMNWIRRKWGNPRLIVPGSQHE